jgi:hypothetical protein
MSLITETVLAHLPSKKKITPSGWISFNAPCCDDKRQRGGLIINNGTAVSYHCFNCQFKASWQPGRTLSQKMRKFMRLLHMSDDTISKLGLEALRLNEEATQGTDIVTLPKFETRALPPDSAMMDTFNNLDSKLIEAMGYLADRRLFLDDYDFYWTPKVGFSNRVIIPFYYQGQLVGYTARAINDAKPKYISEQQPGFVFNLDGQDDERDFVIVCEGPFDAISIDGCALLGAEIKEAQNLLLKQLGKELVLVPDRDHEGPKTVEHALEFGWSVSMPDWPEGIKDVNDAVIKLGRLATLWLIASAKESNSLKIKLKAKTWFKESNSE